jgi:hypothetical protein
MCWFVTMGVTSAGAAALEELGRARGGLGISKSSNPHLARIFGANDVRFEVTHGGCSCDLYTAPRERDPGERERARARYRRKGWSETKIARALEASETAKSAGVGRNREIWPEHAFRDAISRQVREFGIVRIFAHIYNASQSVEQVACLGRRRITLNAFLESGFPPNELVEIVDEAR